MPDPAPVTVPVDQVDGVVETLLALFGAKAEELGVTTTDYLEGTKDLRALLECRRELEELEDALIDAEWRRAGHTRGLELNGPPALVRDVIYGALLDATDAVGEACRKYEEGGAALEELRAAVEAVSVRFGLFAGIERREAL